MTDSTEYTVVSNNYSPGYDVESDFDDEGNAVPWSGGSYAGVGDITTVVTGALADRVRARTGLTGEVGIVEHHFDLGYCPTCSWEEIDFLVRVAGVEVWSTSGFGGVFFENASELNNFGEFNEWLNDTEAGRADAAAARWTTASGEGWGDSGDYPIITALIAETDSATGGDWSDFDGANRDDAINLFAAELRADGAPHTLEEHRTDLLLCLAGKGHWADECEPDCPPHPGRANLTQWAQK